MTEQGKCPGKYLQGNCEISTQFVKMEMEMKQLFCGIVEQTKQRLFMKFKALCEGEF